MVSCKITKEDLLAQHEEVKESLLQLSKAQTRYDEAQNRMSKLINRASGVTVKKYPQEIGSAIFI